jgi:hypothetical protein
LHSTHFKRSNDQLDYHDFLPYSLCPVCEESPQVGASRPYSDDHKRNIEVREESNTHKTRILSTTTHTSKDLSSKGQHREFTTRMELKSLTQQSKCMGAESGCLSMLRECLVFCSMCLGVPFIALRQLRAVGDQFGRPFLPSVEWCTGQSGAPPDSYCSCPVRSPSISGASDRCNSGLVGAPDTIRCAPDSPVHLADRWTWPRVAR